MNNPNRSDGVCEGDVILSDILDYVEIGHDESDGGRIYCEI